MRGDEVNGKRRDGRSRYGLETSGCFIVKNEDEDKEDDDGLGEGRGWGESGVFISDPKLELSYALMIMQIRPRKPNSDSTEEINLLFNSFLLKRI